MITNFYAEITRQIIEMIESGDIKDPKDLWRSLGINWGQPKNVSTKKSYTGINRLLLSMSMAQKKYTHNHWMTFKQAIDNNTPVRKGEHGTKAIFFSVIDTNKIDQEQSSYAMAKWFTVFNIAQLDGYQISEPYKSDSHNTIQQADNFVTSTGANIQIGGSNSAFYSPSKDVVVMPAKEQFFKIEDFYAVLFHELTHWTGHKTRLDRSRNNSFGDEAYAFEELVAELGAAFLCSDMGISHHTMPNHVSYLDNWLTILKTHDRAIFKAASQAEKAVDFLKAKTTISEAA